MKKNMVVAGKIENKIFTIRGQSVMLDRDLAALYGVEVRALNQAVKRNIKRFPPDFMFRLTKEEVVTNCNNLKSQFVISSWGGARTLPYAFTEQGVAMLSSVLNSERAIIINIEIMRTFVAIKQYALKVQDGEKISSRLSILEKTLLSYMEKNDKRVDDIIEVLNAMLEADEKKDAKKIGFIS